MKLLLSLLLLGGLACAQPPAKFMRRDSVPQALPPGVDSPSLNLPGVGLPGDRDLPDPMPNARTDNSFYRYRTDSKNVMRATVDNMPVKTADSSTHYTMLQSFKKYAKPDEPSRQFRKPMPRIVPKKRW